jgi:3-hydroxyacyl-[acyl-carrier-protein] dehydratase
VSSFQDSTPLDDPALREVLKRCSPATYYAACKFRTYGRSEDLRTVVLGVVERFVERDHRPKLTAQGDALRLSEDLGIDSLTMMEIVMLAEEILPVSMSNEELGTLRTLGDVHTFMMAKWATARSRPAPDKNADGNANGIFAPIREDLT